MGETSVSNEQKNDAPVNPPQTGGGGGSAPSLQSNSQQQGIAQARNNLISQVGAKLQMKQEERRMKAQQGLQESCMELLADETSYLRGAGSRDELCRRLGLNLANTGRFKSSATAIFLLDMESKQAIAQLLKAGPKVTFVAAFLADDDN